MIMGPPDIPRECRNIETMSVDRKKHQFVTSFLVRCGEPVGGVQPKTMKKNDQNDTSENGGECNNNDGGDASNVVEVDWLDHHRRCTTDESSNDRSECDDGTTQELNNDKGENSKNDIQDECDEDDWDETVRIAPRLTTISTTKTTGTRTTVKRKNNRLSQTTGKLATCHENESENDNDNHDNQFAPQSAAKKSQTKAIITRIRKRAAAAPSTGYHSHHYTSHNTISLVPSIEEDDWDPPRASRKSESDENQREISNLPRYFSNNKNHHPHGYEYDDPPPDNTGINNHRKLNGNKTNKLIGNNPNNTQNNKHKSCVADSTSQTKAIYYQFSPLASSVIRVEVEAGITSPEQPDHVVLQIEASTVSIQDCIVRRGYDFNVLNPISVPIVPGCHVVGRIISKGYKVKLYNEGDRVAALLGRGMATVIKTCGNESGGNARYISLPVSVLLPIPSKNMDAAVAVATLSAYLPAYQMLKRMKLQQQHMQQLQQQQQQPQAKAFSLKDKKVLIIMGHGATDPVGHALIQMCHKARATIYVVVSASPSLLLSDKHQQPDKRLQYYRRALKFVQLLPRDDWLQYVLHKIDCVFDGACDDGLQSPCLAIKKDIGEIICYGYTSMLRSQSAVSNSYSGHGSSGCNSGTVGSDLPGMSEKASMGLFGAPLSAHYNKLRAQQRSTKYSIQFFDIYESFNKDPITFQKNLKSLFQLVKLNKIVPTICSKRVSLHEVAEAQHYLEWPPQHQAQQAQCNTQKQQQKQQLQQQRRQQRHVDDSESTVGVGLSCSTTFSPPSSPTPSTNGPQQNFQQKRNHNVSSNIINMTKSSDEATKTSSNDKNYPISIAHALEIDDGGVIVCLPWIEPISKTTALKTITSPTTHLIQSPTKATNKQLSPTQPNIKVKQTQHLIIENTEVLTVGSSEAKLVYYEEERDDVNGGEPDCVNYSEPNNTIQSIVETDNINDNQQLIPSPSPTKSNTEKTTSSPTKLNTEKKIMTPRFGQSFLCFCNNTSSFHEVEVNDLTSAE